MWRTIPAVLLAVVTLACFSVKAAGQEPPEPAQEPQRERPEEPRGERSEEPRGEQAGEPRRERPEEMAALHARLAELRERVADLERAGKVDEARALAGEARELQQHLQRLVERRRVELPHRPPAHHELLERQLRHLHAAAENLAAAGLADQAAALRSQAERLERELRQHAGPHPEPPPFVRELHERMERLERQLAELREIVEDLRRPKEMP